MGKLEKMGESDYSSLIQVLFGLSSPSPVSVDLVLDPVVGNLVWFDETLNESQKDAIRFAMASREVALIHGPPGVSFPVRNISQISSHSSQRLTLIQFRQAKRTH